MNERLVALAVAMGMVLAACGGASGDGEQVSSPAASITAPADSDAPTPAETQVQAETEGVAAEAPAAGDSSAPATAGGDEGSLSSLLTGVFTISTADSTFGGLIESCILDGGTTGLETVFQATGSGETDDGEPFNMLIGQYLQDIDGDGVQDTQMQFRLEFGRASIEEPAPTGEISIVGQFNDSASAPSGDMQASYSGDDDQVLNGFIEVRDLSGILSAAEEAFLVSFYVECFVG